MREKEILADILRALIRINERLANIEKWQWADKILITELADALTSQDRPATRPFLREDHELIQKAREAVGDAR
jgi:hypothetical protein